MTAGQPGASQAGAIRASGSGLDPDISPQNPAIQVNRVAPAHRLNPAAIRALVAQYPGTDTGIPG